MPTTDPIQILLAHNHWATRNILDACARLKDEQFHRPFEMGPGSLHDTVTHILGAMGRWCDVLAARETRPRLEGTKRTPADLLMLLDEIAADLLETALAHPTDEIVSGTRAGKAFSLVRAGILVHITTHGMHHRAQCLNMLRHLGVSPLPPSSVVEWIAAEDR
jgi:uncharacterized damage-inducible protein DinB